MHTRDSFRQAISLASTCESSLSSETLAMEGMSSSRVRHLINNLCSLSESIYSEVGCWKGSTLCSALDGTNALCLGIDNWSQFGGPKGECLSACSRFASNRWWIDDSDCFQSRIANETTVFFYDGAHDYVSQYRALSRFSSNFAKICVVLVDDWNESSVKSASLDFIDDRKSEHEVVDSVILPAAYNGDLSQWWNGLGVFLLRKL